MTKMINNLTRRDFIKSTGAAAIGVATLGVPAFTQEVESKYLAKVVLVRNKNAVSGKGKIDGDIIQQMLDQAILNLCG